MRAKVLLAIAVAAAGVAVADTACGPALSTDAGLPAQGGFNAGAFYAADYGPLYLRVSGAYSPMPSRPWLSMDWPPSSESDDHGYTSCEALGALFPPGSPALGLGIYAKFGRGVRDYYYHISGPTVETKTEDYVAFKYDAMAVAACRVWTAGKGTAVFWGGAGMSHFRRQGLRDYYSSDFYNPENFIEIITPLDTRMTSLVVGAGVDVRVRFAGPFGAYGAARGVVPLVDFHVQGYDGAPPGAGVALTAGGLVGW